MKFVQVVTERTEVGIVLVLALDSEGKLWRKAMYPIADGSVNESAWTEVA